MSTHRDREPERDTLKETSAYRLMSHVYRRALVDCLGGRREGIAMADAAAEVAARNLDPSVAESSPETVADVYAALHHCHVPKLVDEGIVAHDRDRNVVSLTERGRELAAVQEGIASGPDGDDAAVPDGYI